MSAAITGPGLQWTTPRFLSPRKGEPKNRVRSGFFGTDWVGWAITRADIAKFLVGQLTDRSYVEAAPAISN